jgi:peptidase M23-like protein
MQGAPMLVASFAEYRPDHLHPGIDLSTGGRTGLPVYAVMGGEVFRLKVEWRGYGRAIYLRHSDGRISVYAHLERFNEAELKLESRVEEARKSTGQRYPGDIYLDPPVPVNPGQQIATSGESGAGMPHLHYELRKDDQRPGDPSAVLGRLPRGKSPRLEALVLLPREAGVLVEGGRSAEIRLSRDRSGIYAPSKDVVVSGPFLPEARIVAEDDDGHRLGIQGLSVKLDGKLVYRTILKEFSFEQYPQVGLLLDHARSRLSPTEFTYRLARLPGNTLGLVHSPPETAWPSLGPGRHQLQWEVNDALGGTATARVPFLVVSPPSLRWEPDSRAAADSYRLSLHSGAPRDATSPLRILYTSIGAKTPLPCGDREILPDGESCTFPVRPGGGGITATALMAQTAVARVTHPFPITTGQHPPAPPIQVVPSMRFVDLEVSFTDANPYLPARLLLESPTGVLRHELSEREPGVLVASIPLEQWQKTVKVEAEWDTPSGPVRTHLPLAIHVVYPEEPLEIKDCGVKIKFPAGSTFAPTPVACSKYAGKPPTVEGLDLRGPVVKLLPEGTPLSRKATVSFPSPAGKERGQRLGIYRLDRFRGQWAFMGGERTDTEISVPVGRFDTLALLEDLAPPRILGIEPSLGDGYLVTQPRFVIRVEDTGSGLSYDGIHLAVDGEELEMEYDPDRGWSSGSPSGPLSRGGHTIRLWAEDRSGNRTEDATFQVVVR